MAYESKKRKLGHQIGKIFVYSLIYQKIIINMITKEKFLRYEKVRQSGNYNMIMEANYAMNDANLTKDEYFDIIKNYSDYCKQFN